jgi:hypothetical protein
LVAARRRPTRGGPNKKRPNSNQAKHAPQESREIPCNHWDLSVLLKDS